MKALLISANQCIDPYPVYPLGMGVMAQVLTDSGVEVVQKDILVHGSSGIQSTLETEVFDLIGISIRNIDTVNSSAGNTTLTGAAFELVKLCRKFSSAKIVLGGAGFTLYPERIMALSGADFGIVGEGEESMRKVLRMLEKGEDGPTLIRSECPVQSPALYDGEILDHYCKKTHIISMQTKRGCPFNCVYCTYPKLEGRSVRQRDTGAICRQIRELKERYPEALFFFVDSIFNDSKGEYKIFLEEMMKQCGKVPFSCFITPEALTAEDIDLLHRAGLVLADIGIDAASDTTLRGMGKNFTFAHALDCVKQMQQLDIGISCSVIVGAPGESYETLEEGIRNLHALEPAVVGVFSGVRIIAGTPLYEIASKRGMIPPEWDGLTPLYFFEEGVEQEKIDERLLAEFKDNKNILYPPDRMNRMLRTIHKIGYLQFRNFLRGDEQ